MIDLRSKIKSLTNSELKEFIESLSADELKYLEKEWTIWARNNQLPPPGSWSNWLILAGRGFGKALADYTPILTKGGWKRLDELEIGTKIYDEKGKLTSVVDIFIQPDKLKTYRVIFDDKSYIDACENHLWTVLTNKYSENKKLMDDFINWPTYVDKIKTTKELLDVKVNNGSRSYRHRIPTSQPLLFNDNQSKKLLIDPYILGYHLGDGRTGRGRITSDFEDQLNLKRELDRLGYHHYTNGMQVYITGLTKQLREVGLLRDTTKFIPHSYLFSSITQRQELIRGLMDSDGTIAEDGKCVFYNVNKLLVEQVDFVLKSLGIKTNVTGRKRKENEQTAYSIRFRPNFNCFKLERKLKRVKIPKPGDRSTVRRIIEIKEIEPQNMRCIKVDSPNSLFLAGYSLIPTHNTRTGAEWVREQVKLGAKRIALVGPTAGDVRDTMIEGHSGLMSVCYEGDHTYAGEFMGIPEYEPSKRRVTWANGAIATAFSADAYERLRGPQHEKAWIDELCAFKKMNDTWDMLQFGLRLGVQPQSVITTTPKPSKLLKQIIKDDSTVTTTGSTYDNKANLADVFIKRIEEKYEGTRLGQQELHAHILEDVEGALWDRNQLEELRVREFPELVKIVVAIDPAVTSEVNSDETGIVVAGIDSDKIAYVIEDATFKGTPKEWAKKAVSLYKYYKANKIIGETNQGGDLIREVIHAIDERVPYSKVHAKKGKYLRAEPVSALYEQGKVKHYSPIKTKNNLDLLEDQMCNFTNEGLPDGDSPDRLDAMVYAITELLVKPRTPRVRVI